MSLAVSGERGGTGGRRYTDKAMKRWKDEFPWVDEHPGKTLFMRFARRLRWGEEDLSVEKQT